MREMPNKNTVWVLAPRRLVTFLDHEPRRLSQEDIHLASFHLSRFVRTAEQSGFDEHRCRNQEKN